MCMNNAMRNQKKIYKEMDPRITTVHTSKRLLTDNLRGSAGLNHEHSSLPFTNTAVLQCGIAEHCIMIGQSWSLRHDCLFGVS